MAQQASVQAKAVYAITERDGRSFWSRVGVAFSNRDGSLNISLDALPVSGRLQVRDDEPREERDRPESRSRESAHRR